MTLKTLQPLPLCWALRDAKRLCGSDPGVSPVTTPNEKRVTCPACLLLAAVARANGIEWRKIRANPLRWHVNRYVKTTEFERWCEFIDRVRAALDADVARPDARSHGR